MSIPVLFIHGITEIGGAERELLLILEHLRKQGYGPVVVCPDTGPLVEELERLGIEMRYVPLPPWRKILAYPKRARAIRRLRDVITEIRPALIHVNDIWWVPHSLRASSGSGVPILAHVRQEIEPPKVHRYGLDRADVVLPMSRHIQQSLEAGGVPGRRLLTLYSALDMTRVPQQEDGRRRGRRFGIPDDVPLIGTVANLFPRKGYEVILKALPKILTSCPTMQYVLIGQGGSGYERTLRSLVRTLGLENNVRFVGFQKEVYSCLAAMDIYVHPALMEGFGIAMLEAMAMEKPIVASRVGGIPEVVEDGVTGLLVPPGDPSALALALMRLLEEPHTRERMGRAGRERLETHFTAEQIMSTLRTLYAEISTRQDVGKTRGNTGGSPYPVSE